MLLVLPAIRVLGGGAVQEKFMILQHEYQAMIDAVVPLLMENSFISIKEYLVRYRKEISPADIQKCTDERSLITLVTDRCSITQCHKLYLMAKHFNSQALKYIESYNLYKNEVYSQVKATKFSQILFREQKFPGEIQVSPQ